MEPKTRSAARPASLEYKPWLRKSELFAQLDDEELDALASYCDLQRCSGGEPIFARGAPGDALYVVVEGRVAIGHEETGSQVIAEMVAGDSFGELEFLSGRPRNANAEGIVDSLLLRFPRQGTGFSTVVQSTPALSARILESFLASLAGRIRKANALLKENSPWVKELRRQAHSDKLTGLNNKTFLEERLRELLAGGHGGLALLMLKPDNFKEINDSFGHEAGDATLRLMASALSQALVRDEDAARFQGNELAVVMPGRDRDAARAEAERLGAVLRALDLRELTEGSGIRLGVSFGIALSPEHGSSADSLIEVVRGLPLLGRARGGNALLFPEDS
ncbi:MAG TPA: GGDEF domain-containing protein [Rectinemataceae bacterium]|nr:GGDEF domain-containing protein [Rectinemataceae bacterium]